MHVSSLVIFLGQFSGFHLMGARAPPEADLLLQETTLFYNSILSWVEPKSTFYISCMLRSWFYHPSLQRTRVPTPKWYRFFKYLVVLTESPLRWSWSASVPSTSRVCLLWLPSSLPTGRFLLSVSFLTSHTESPSASPLLHLRINRSNQRSATEWPGRNRLESHAPMA